MQLAEVAGSLKALKRLEVIRQLNARSGWINQKLYKLMLSPDLYVLAYERIKSEPGNMTQEQTEKNPRRVLNGRNQPTSSRDANGEIPMQTRSTHLHTEKQW